MKQSGIFREKQSIIKKEMIDCIRKILSRNEKRIELNEDLFNLSIGYNIDCECIDDLLCLYIIENKVFADLYDGDEVDIVHFHESSLIDILDYFERHEFSHS